MTGCGMITFNYFHKDLRHERFYNCLQLTESRAEIHTNSGIAVVMGTGCSQKHINVKKKKTACCCAIWRNITNVEIENV